MKSNITKTHGQQHVKKSMFWLDTCIGLDRVMVKRMVGISETKCGFVTPSFTK